MSVKRTDQRLTEHAPLVQSTQQLKQPNLFQKIFCFCCLPPMTKTPSAPAGIVHDTAPNKLHTPTGRAPHSPGGTNEKKDKEGAVLGESEFF